MPEGRALVPGSGRGYEVVALASANRHCLGIEIVPKAIEESHEYINSLPAEMVPHRDKMEFRLASFFDLDPTHKFTFIFDYMFLCALDPSTHPLWAAKMGDLVAPGGELLTLLYPISDDKEGGPPYRLTLEMAKNLLEPVGFHAKLLELLPPQLCHQGRDGVEAPVEGSISGIYPTAVGRWIRA